MGQIELFLSETSRSINRTSNKLTDFKQNAFRLSPHIGIKIHEQNEKIF